MKPDQDHRVHQEKDTRLGQVNCSVVARDDFKYGLENINLVFTVGTKLLVLSIILILSVLVAIEITSDSIYVGSIDTTETLQSSGYSSRVLSRMLATDLIKIEDSATKSLSKSGFSPEDTIPPVAIPGAGISLRDAAELAKRLFHLKDNAIRGELIARGSSIVIRVRTTGQDGRFSDIESQDPSNDIDRITSVLAENIMDKKNPYLLGMYYAVKIFSRCPPKGCYIADFKKAFDELDKVIAAPPLYDDPWGYLGYGHIMLRYLNNPSAAIEQYKKSSVLYPNFGFAYVNWGDALREKGDTKAAIEQYNKAIAINRKPASTLKDSWGKPVGRNLSFVGSAYVGLGNVHYENDHNLPDAEANYRKALEADPHNAFAYVGLGNVHLENKDRESAKDMYKKAIENDQQSSHAYYAFGNLYLQIGNLDAVLNQFNSADIHEVKTNLAYHSCQQQYSAIKDRKLGIGLYKEAIKRSHKADFSDDGFREAVRGTTDPDAAIQMYNKGLQQDPKNAFFNINYGNALRAKGDPDAAIEYYKKATNSDQNKKSAYAYDAWGNALREKGNPDQAIEQYENAIKANPYFGWAYYNWGNALREKGDLDAAIDKYKKATVLKGKFECAHYSWGETLRDKGDINAALVQYMKAIEFNSDFACPFYAIYVCDNVLRNHYQPKLK